MILMSPVSGLTQATPVTTSYDPARKDLGVSSERSTRSQSFAVFPPSSGTRASLSPR